MALLSISNFFLWWRRLPALVLALMVAAPLFFLLQLALTSDGDSWHYIMRITIERHLGTTMLLVLGVMMMSLLAGSGVGVACDFISLSFAHIFAGIIVVASGCAFVHCGFYLH